MSSASDHAGQVDGVGDGDRVPLSQDVCEQLSRILTSAEFVASDRLKSFLRFVVEEALAGRADRLKAYTIAVEVFGRDASFDAQNDPVVRMEAGKLRRRLENYYLGAGRDDPIRIEIPKGSYAPTFTMLSGVEAAEERVEGRPPLARSRPWRFGLWGVSGLLVAGLVVLVATWLWPPLASVEVREARQQRGPAIIVLPFANLSGDPDNVFAAGLTEELITNLMRFGELRLYSAHGSFREQPTADPVELSERLDVGYVVRGGVRRESDRIRLIVHLVEAQTGQHVWSATYDRELTPENVFAVQEKLAADLAGELAQPYGIINEVTAESFRHQRPETLFAYECVLRAFAYRRTLERERYAPVRACLEEAVRQDPDYADAWALLAFVHLDRYRYGYAPGLQDASVLDLALDTARRAIEVDRDNVLALLALSSIQFFRREFAEAEETNRRLLALNPTNPEVLAQVGWRTAFASDWDKGIDLVRQAIDRSIVAPHWYYIFPTLDAYREGDYRAALAEAEQMADARFVWIPVILAAIHGQLGNPDQAQSALDRANALDPSVLRNPRDAMRLRNIPEDLIDHLIDGLLKAGLTTS